LNIDVKINNEEALKAYKIFGDLGKGAYGTVRMGINQRNDERVAVKVYDKRKLD
jgi:serine/threonine protein kinase